MYPYSLNFNEIDEETVEVEQYNPNLEHSPPATHAPHAPLPPSKHHEGGHKPLGAPPQHVPEKKARFAPGLSAIDPHAIRGCQNDYTYIWLHSGRSFWMYITFVGRQSISGYRWSRFGWTYTGIDLRSIESFACSRF